MIKTVDADDGMKMPLGKRKLRELIEDAWYDAPSASAGFGRIEAIIEQQIKADRKKHELQAKKNGFYMAAGLYGADASRVEELWVKCEQELEKL